MTNNLKIEVSVSDIPEGGSIASQFPSREYVDQRLAKKANLSDEGRLDPKQAPDYTEIPGLFEHIEDTKEVIGVSIAESLQDAKGYANQQLSTSLRNKADLVNGKIPFDQIPFSADIEDQIQINVENITAVVDQKIALVVEQVNEAATAANSYTDTKVAENTTFVKSTIGNVMEDVKSTMGKVSVKKDLIVPTYLTPETGVDAVDGVTDGAYFNVLSEDDDTIAIEYQNIGGVPIPSGKEYPTSNHNSMANRDVAGAHPASAILDASNETQQQVNYNGGSKWHSRNGGYLQNERVVLNNGGIVKSKINGNVTNPNVNMTGWEVPSLKTADNLSDVPNKAAARSNLSVYSQTEVNNAIANATIPDATETVAGKAKIATTEIAQAWFNDTDFLTTKKLRDALNAAGTAPIFACRAWVSFDASTGVIANLVGGNIASVVRSQEGMYRITFTTAMLNDNYAILCSHGDAASGFIRVIYRSKKSCVINTLNTSNILKDANFISIGVFC